MICTAREFGSGAVAFLVVAALVAGVAAPARWDMLATGRTPGADPATPAMVSSAN